MQVPATIEHPAAPTAQPSVRERRISKPVRKAIDLLESGECKTQKAAAQRAGLSEQYLCRALKKDNVGVFIARRRAENLARGSLRASYRFAELVEASSEHVAAKVCERILENAGDLKTGNGINISINNSVAPGYVIDMRDPRDARPVQPVIDAASLPDKG